MSPYDSATVVKMRSDLQEISDCIHDFEISADAGWFQNDRDMLIEQNNILRMLLTSYMALTSAEYQTEERLILNMLCKKVLSNE